MLETIFYWNYWSEHVDTTEGTHVTGNIFSADSVFKKYAILWRSCSRYTKNPCLNSACLHNTLTFCLWTWPYNSNSSVQAVSAVVLGLFPMLLSLHSRYKVLPLQPARDNPGVTNANAKSLERRRRRKRRTAVSSCNSKWIPSGAECMSSEAKTRSKKEDKPVTCRLCLITPWILFMFQERMDDFVTIRLPSKS